MAYPKYEMLKDTIAKKPVEAILHIDAAHPVTLLPHGKTGRRVDKDNGNTTTCLLMNLYCKHPMTNYHLLAMNRLRCLPPGKNTDVITTSVWEPTRDACVQVPITLKMKRRILLAVGLFAVWLTYLIMIDQLF